MEKENKKVKKKSITITLPLYLAETLEGLVDGCVGSSEDDNFTDQMTIVLRKLEKVISKHYK